MQNQRRKGAIVMIPPPGKTSVIFIDDINMPETEFYGAQPPIELLRQYQDYKGFYDRKSNQWKMIESAVLICAAAPPGGCRSVITPRFTRHFNVMNIQKTSEESLAKIFSSILNGFMKDQNFKPEIKQLGENESLVKATL